MSDLRKPEPPKPGHTMFDFPLDFKPPKPGHTIFDTPPGFKPPLPAWMKKYKNGDPDGKFGGIIRLFIRIFTLGTCS